MYSENISFSRKKTDAVVAPNFINLLSQQKLPKLKVYLSYLFALCMSSFTFHYSENVLRADFQKMPYLANTTFAQKHISADGALLPDTQGKEKKNTTVERELIQSHKARL